MIKYPTKILHSKTSIAHSKRGMDFEEEINLTNIFYREHKIAFIYKKPTPIKIVKCSRFKNTYRIDEGFFMQPSTTDYNGIYRGKYIDFEAKQTHSSTSFPFSNILDNQIQHIFNVLEAGGLCFILIDILILNSIYLIKGQTLKEEIEKGKRSFSFDFIKKEGYIVPSYIGKYVDYLSVVDKIYFEQ